MGTSEIDEVRRSPRPVGDDGGEEPLPSRHGALVAAVLLALAVVVGAQSTTTRSGGPPAGRVGIERSTEVLAPPPVGGGSGAQQQAGTRSAAWVHLTGLPLDHVAGSPALVLGDRIYVLGARDDQVALAAVRISSAVRGRAAWELLPGAPLSARAAPLLSSLGGGDSLVVWGGRRGPDGHGPALDDGAMLDVATGSWTTVPRLPGPPGTPPVGSARDVAVVDGRLVLVAGAGPRLDRARPVAWSWEPGEAAWSPLPAPPVDAIHAVDVLAVGSRIVATVVIRDEGTRWGDVVTLSTDGAGGRWQEHEVVPLRRQHRAAAVALDDHRVALWGRPSTAGRGTAADGLVLELLTGTWWRLPPPPPSLLDGTALAVDATTSGSDLVVGGAGLTSVLRHGVDERRWESIAPLPSSGAVGRLAVAEGQLVWWGRHADGVPTLSVLRAPLGQAAPSRASAAFHPPASPDGS